MKLQNFLLFIVLNFPLFTTSNQFVKRNLVDNIPEFFLIGFEKYTYNNPEERTFNIHLIIDGTKEIYPYIYFNTSVIYQYSNKNNIIPAKCSKFKEFDDQSLTYECIVKNDIKNNITNISLNNYRFIVTNSSNGKNFTVYENQIILSALAKEKRKNIEKEIDPLNFNIFYLNEDPKINKNGVELYGNIIWKDNNYASNFNIYLNLEENINCRYSFNYSGNNYDKISFSPQTYVNVYLDKMIAETNYPLYPYILFISNTTNDLILYSKFEDKSFELLGFSDFVPPKTDTKTDAKNRAYFKGSINNLKKYMRFTVKIINSTTLRFLEESINVTAKGIMDTYNIDLKNGLVIYNITYINTANYKSIVGMESFHDYEFSDDNVNFYKSSTEFIYDKENINLTNTENMIIEFFAFNSSNRFESNAFSFDFSIPQTKQKYNISGKGHAFLNYKYMENSTRYEIGCSVVNKSNLYKISCKPEKDVYTLLKTIRIKIPQVQSTDRLRLLDEDGNSTFYAPHTQSGDIQFDYVPQFKTFARKDSQNTGLSAGAIVAIILSSLAVIAAVGLTIFFLNRKPINPGPKYINGYNNQNSSININK